MVDGSVMVTFIPKKVNTFVLLEMNCKINSIGGAKIPYFVYKWRRGALLYLENTLKLFLCILTGFELTATRKLCRSDCYCVFYAGLIYPTQFL